MRVAMSERTGTTPHQHAIILHELANQIRGTVATDAMSKDELLRSLDSMRAFLGGHMVRLLDDSRALAASEARAASAEAELADLKPKYAALLAEIDAHDQASSWASTAATVTTTLRADALAAANQRLTALVRRAETIISDEWTGPDDDVLSGMDVWLSDARALLKARPAAEIAHGDG
jgi:hypothetical protein